MTFYGTIHVQISYEFNQISTIMQHVSLDTCNRFLSPLCVVHVT